MIRLLFTAAAVMSLVLCVALGLLWLRDHRGEEKSGWDLFVFARRGGSLWKLESESGWLTFVRVRGWPNDEPFQHFFYTFAHGLDGPVPYFQNRTAKTWKLNNTYFLEAGYCTIELQANGDSCWENRYVPNYARGIVAVRDSAPLAYWSISVRKWVMFVLSGGPPLIIFFGRLTRSRRVKRCARRGVCENCGYDLRASTGRCPECGTPIPAQVKA